MKTAIFGLGMILALASSAALAQRGAVAERGEAVPAARGALPAPAARKMLNNAAQRIEMKNIEAKVDRIGGANARGGSVGREMDGSLSTADAVSELSDAEKLELHADLSSSLTTADATTLDASRKAVMKNFVALSTLVARDEGSANAYANFISTEVTTWNCGACVEGFNSVQKDMITIATTEAARGNEVTLPGVFKGAMTAAGKWEKYEDNCPLWF